MLRCTISEMNAAGSSDGNSESKWFRRCLTRGGAVSYGTKCSAEIRILKSAALKFAVRGVKTAHAVCVAAADATSSFGASFFACGTGFGATSGFGFAGGVETGTIAGATKTNSGIEFEMGVGIDFGVVFGPGNGAVRRVSHAGKVAPLPRPRGGKDSALSDGGAFAVGVRCSAALAEASATAATACAVGRAAFGGAALAGTSATRSAVRSERRLARSRERLRAVRLRSLTDRSSGHARMIEDSEPLRLVLVGREGISPFDD